MMRPGWGTALAAALLAAHGAAAQDSTATRRDTVVVYTVDLYTGRVIGADTGRTYAASPLLDETHWAVRAAWRAEALGLTRFLPAQRAVPRAEVAAALAEAARNAAARPALRRMANAWLARFREEFPEYGDAGARSVDQDVYLLGGEATGGFERSTGRIAPAIGYAGYRQLPKPLRDVSDPRATVYAAASAGPVMGEAEPAVRAGKAVLARWDLAAGYGHFQLSIGRETEGFGFARTGGIVYSALQPLGRVELQSTRPFILPWILRYLGPTTLDVFAGPVRDSARFPTKPDMWGMRVAVQPFPRLTLAANRGSIFGGRASPVTAWKLARMFVGVVHSDFENQVASGEIRYRLPTDRVLPATAYVEWGADDAAGAIQSEPGRIIGLFLPALPGVPQAGLGVEYTYFKHACCGHGPWYFNTTFPGNWARRGETLGHPLGGEGAEYAAYGQAEALDARLRLDGRAFIRDRSSYSYPVYGGGNLFDPTRAGRSTGGQLEAGYRIFPHADARAGFATESGRGWRQNAFHAELAWLF
jgi:hypothetical protein